MDKQNILNSQQFSRKLAKIAMAVICVLLIGCANVVPQKSADATYDAKPTFKPLSKGERLSGIKPNDLTLDDKELIQLQTVKLLLKERKVSEAKHIIKSIKNSSIPNKLTNTFQLVLADLALAENKPQESLKALSNIYQMETFSPESQVELLDSRASAYVKLGFYIEAVQALIEKESYLESPELIDDNHLLIWSYLNNAKLQELKPEANDSFVLSGWKSLVRLNKMYEDTPRRFELALEKWLDSHPEHPAATLFQNTQLNFVALNSNNDLKQVALLLPLTGKYSHAGQAVKNGILAAYYDYQNKNNKAPSLRMYDTADESALAPIYRQAVNEGANAIIGPLTKNGVEQINVANRGHIPIIGLNSLQTKFTNQGSEQLYQFGLIPEDEVTQVAKQAWSDGRMNAVVINPDDNWGARIGSNFISEWKKLGGNIIDQATYTPNNDLALPIQNILHIQKSKARVNRLKRLIGMQVESKTRRRTDIDMIFLVATPELARRINPLLAFYYASDIPIYSTSSLYSGYSDPKKDLDINGVTFCDAPWVLSNDFQDKKIQSEIKEVWPENIKAFSRMYALGVDAFHLLYQVNRMRRFDNITYAGATGKLTLSKDLRITRQLPCAKFTHGQAKVLDSVL